MSVILGKYTVKKKLGKGAYGDVVLVEDNKKKEWAIKIISKKILEKDSFMVEYLEGEKECMKSVKSEYIMQLYDFEEDETNQYLVCEYCEGGDLLNYQAQQPNKVFKLDVAIKILADVIRGLEVLHLAGYLHRDIKSQNILLKNTETKGKYAYKLADFGFAKKAEDIGGTILGTQSYMSPEIYLSDIYGFEVDMWAFGILFFFMLNLEFPFKINPHQDPEAKRQELLGQAAKFKYSSAVEKTKKCIKENCTKEMDDLFSKIFTQDSESRITFAEIRDHPIFKQHFGIISQDSKIMYFNKKPKNSRLGSAIYKPLKGKPGKSEDPINAVPSIVLKRPRHQKYPQEKSCIDSIFERAKFLEESDEEIIQCKDIAHQEEILALKYCLRKYHLILLRKLIESLTLKALESSHPKLNWQQFCKTQEFLDCRKEYKDALSRSEVFLVSIYGECKDALTKIEKKNPDFKQILSSEVLNEDQFSGKFKEVYRQATSNLYGKLSKVIKKGNKYPYLTAIVTICHSFNQIFGEDSKNLEQLFEDYIAETGSKGQTFNFEALRSWMTTCNQEKLSKIRSDIFKRYFS